MAQFAATPALVGEFSKAGRQRTEEERAATKRLEAGTGYGLTDVERRDILRQTMEPIEAQAREAREQSRQQSLAQGPFSSGQLFKQEGQTQAAVAQAQGQVGMDLARYSSEVAKQEQERDRAMRDQRIARITALWQAGMPGSGAPAMTGKGWSDPSAAGEGEGEDDPTTGDDESLQTDGGQAVVKIASSMYGVPAG
tara:strand:- start:766 stop:1353 length:588 start_codon:yes stop_codon:yes gene_type:complete